jgi:hypothetical protein
MQHYPSQTGSDANEARYGLPRSIRKESESNYNPASQITDDSEKRDDSMVHMGRDNRIVTLFLASPKQQRFGLSQLDLSIIYVWIDRNALDQVGAIAIPQNMLD